MQNTTLDQYLKELRKACNYSQEFVASHLNITRQTYSHYETGRIIPPTNSLYNIAKLYGIPVENLLDLVVTYNINMDFAKKKADWQFGLLRRSSQLLRIHEPAGGPKKTEIFGPQRAAFTLLLYAAGPA